MIGYVLALPIGGVAGLCIMTTLAAVSSGAYFGWLRLEGTGSPSEGTRAPGAHACGIGRTRYRLAPFDA